MELINTTQDFIYYLGNFAQEIQINIEYQVTCQFDDLIEHMGRKQAQRESLEWFYDSFIQDVIDEKLIEINLPKEECLNLLYSYCYE